MSRMKSGFSVSMIVVSLSLLASCSLASERTFMTTCAWRPDTTHVEAVAARIPPPIVRVGEIWPAQGACGRMIDLEPSPLGGWGAALKVLLDERAKDFGYRVTLLSGACPCGAVLPDSVYCATPRVPEDSAWWGRLFLPWPSCEQAVGNVRFAVAVQAVDRHGNESAPSDTVWVTNRCLPSGGLLYK